MTSCFSYHIYRRKLYFETLKLKQAGVVILGDNKVGKVHGIGMVMLKMFDDLELLLHNARYMRRYVFASVIKMLYKKMKLMDSKIRVTA